MNQEELYAIIERYLDGTLTDAERGEVENRLANDPDFRTEVQLHRALRAELGNPDSLRLRMALDTLMLQPPPLDETPDQLPPAVTTPRGSRLWLIGIAIVVLLTGFFIWQRLSPPDAPPPTIPESGQPDSTLQVVPNKSLAHEPKLHEQPDSTAQVKKNSGVIAMADPKDFTPNPALEDRISDQLRGGSASSTHVDLSSPATGATIYLRQGAAMLLFQGKVTSDSLPGNRPLQLFIYSNRPEAWEKRQPRYTLPFLKKPAAAERTYAVRFQQRLLLVPGLYYLVVGQAREAADGPGYQALWFGKVVVRTTKQ